MGRRRDVGTVELLQLWLVYTDFQSKQLSPSTIQRDYNNITKRLVAMPDLPSAVSVRDWLLRHYAAETTRRTLQKLSACCKWAVLSGYITHDPIAPLLSGFRKNSRGDRRAFSAADRDTILRAISEDEFSSNYGSVHHSFYAPYIKFLFWTGCRIEEATALHWEDVTNNLGCIRFCRALPADTRLLGDIKTHRNREFPCNNRLKGLLSALASDSPLVFPAPRGGAIDAHNVGQRIWKPALTQLVKLGRIREYLPLKHARHTFITLALESGMEVKDVAVLVGNSPEVIYQHYAAVRVIKEVPEF